MHLGLAAHNNFQNTIVFYSEKTEGTLFTVVKMVKIGRKSVGSWGRTKLTH